MKLDALVRDGDYGIVIDYKTGRMFGNEVKHAEQGQLYQLAAFLLFPELEYIDVEFWYTDQSDIKRRGYTRKQGMQAIQKFTNIGTDITSEEEFAPSPSTFACKWCPYKETGDCKYAVK
jgi:hypothetical protein